MLMLRKFAVKHADMFTLLVLGLFFYIIFFHNIWAYPLMDVDETRYVSMAKDMFNTKDWWTLYLNNEYFFEKPPLYFWCECLAFNFFGCITEGVARFPAAVCGTLCCFLTYLVGKKAFTRTFGVFSALILATSLEFLILARFAILDIVVTTCIWFSLCFGMMTEYTEEKYKKYFWWLFYICSGLAVMAKGIPGFVIPFGSMFLISLYNRNLKEVFKPKYFLVGIILFLIITLPWHILMLKIHDPLFFNEYIMKHHVARFLGSDIIGRRQPFYFYILTILWGFFPWIVSTLPVLIRKIQQKDFKYKNLNDVQRFMMYNGIIAVFTLLFFSISETKLITYILPIYGSIAFLGGYLWTKYIWADEYCEIINKTVYILGGVFILASILACFTQYYLPAQLNSDISSVKPLCIVLLFWCGVLTIFFTKKERYLGVFFTYVIFMAILSGFGTEKFFKIDYKFGQDDIMNYAEFAKATKKHVTCYQFTHKYSLLFYGNGPVKFGKDMDVADLKKELEDHNRVIIVPHKKITPEFKNLKYDVIGDGRKYTLIRGKRK